MRISVLNYRTPFNFMGLNTKGRKKRKNELRIHPAPDHEHAASSHTLRSDTE